jgi:nitroreductase
LHRKKISIVVLCKNEDALNILLSPVNIGYYLDPKEYKVSSRTADFPVDAQFLNRWSTRAFADTAISEQELNTILEAARWAPSAYNAQPWRFVYARRGTAHWDALVGLLNDFNRSWAEKASALVIVVSKTTALLPGAETPVDFPTHSFDAGSAWGFLALQATLNGWSAHAMAGFDKDKARTDLGIPADYAVEAAIAIGKPGDKSSLPDYLQARDVPSPRESLAKLAFEGKFQA